MLRSIIRGESVDQRAAAHGQLLLIKRVGSAAAPFVVRAPTLRLPGT